MLNNGTDFIIANQVGSKRITLFYEPKSPRSWAHSLYIQDDAKAHGPEEQPAEQMNAEQTPVCSGLCCDFAHVSGLSDPTHV